MSTCELCGEPMPPGEEMFKFHGYSGPCPKQPLPKAERRMRDEINELRPEVLAFALLMERRMRDHDADKGTSWKRMSGKELGVHAHSKMFRLEEAIRKIDPETAGRHAVDLANYCMMISDVAWQLDEVFEIMQGEPHH